MTFDIRDLEATTAGIIKGFLSPKPGDVLPTHYVAKRGRELCMVRRDLLTITERANHVRRLRKNHQTAEADALELETSRLDTLAGAARRP
jgi:hypothetical protein